MREAAVSTIGIGVAIDTKGSGLASSRNRLNDHLSVALLFLSYIYRINLLGLRRNVVE